MQYNTPTETGAGNSSPDVIAAQQPAQPCQTAPTGSVGFALAQAQAWRLEFERTGCFSAAGCADFWLAKASERLAR